MQLSVNLQKRLSANFALDVKFSVPPGITMLFGASGSGKTTLLRCIAGLIRPDSGQIKIGDQTLFDSDSRVDVPVRERKVGFLFQSLALFPHLSVAKNIEYGLNGLDRADAPETHREYSQLVSHLRHSQPQAE